MRRVAIGTGGGDATGLNAVIRSAVLTGRVKLVPLDGLARRPGGCDDDDTPRRRFRSAKCVGIRREKMIADGRA